MPPIANEAASSISWRERPRIDVPQETDAELLGFFLNSYNISYAVDAIIKLVDLMKRNPGVGASCGRIHPTGTGYMQWYQVHTYSTRRLKVRRRLFPLLAMQMFEYAIGHWLQKATEHVMGCVLCSPGNRPSESYLFFILFPRPTGHVVHTRICFFQAVSLSSAGSQ